MAEEFQQMRNRVLSGETVSGLEVRWQRRNGSPVDLSVSDAPLYDADGRPAGLVAVLADVTERKRLEEQLRQSQKMEAIGVLAGGVAHDFNNLLNVITGFTEIARDLLPPDHAAQDHLDKVNSAAFRAADLTRKLLAFSRRQVLQVELVSFNDVLEDFSRMLSRIVGEDVEVAISKAPELLLVKADTGQLEQVLLNLCTNARQAMPDGGRLRIETRRAVLDGDFAASHPWARSGAFAQISVSDSGIGMDEPTRRRIFEPFFTTKPTGTGLGLAMVYGIVEQHNGFLSVYSEVGHGTTFHLYFPLQESGELAARHAAEVAVPLTGGNETLLLAEDDPMVRDLFSGALAQLGYVVIEAENGEDALQKFESVADSIQLAILDVIMPRLSGRDTYLRMKALRPALKVLFISGYSPEFTQLAGLVDNRTVAILQKPVSSRIVAQRVRKLLDSP